MAVDIVVRNGTIVSASNFANANRRDISEPASNVGALPVDPWLRKTIPELFSLASETVTQSVGGARIEFDKKYGFPTVIAGDMGGAIDSDHHYDVTNFAVLE